MILIDEPILYFTTEYWRGTQRDMWTNTDCLYQKLIYQNNNIGFHQRLFTLRYLYPLSKANSDATGDHHKRLL